MTAPGGPDDGGAPLVTVAVLTRDRPQAFADLLDALTLQRMRDFELVVVGAHPDVRDHGASEAAAARLSYHVCEAENVSTARNIALSRAAGRYIAFIDDDAAPEPDWLDEITRPFVDPHVGAVGGFVRGRNGVDFQWRGALVDLYGAHSEVTATDVLAPYRTAAESTHFLSTVGVNCAFRTSALRRIGGFDESFEYFLDESDACYRLLKADMRTVLAPRAEVFHAYAPSAQRRANRAPRDLFQTAASRAYFAATHGDPAEVETRLETFRADQAARMRKFTQLGRISRRMAEEMMAGLEDGLAEGRARRRAGPRIGEALDETPAATTLRYVPPGAPRRLRAAIVVTTGHRRRLRDAARALRDAGAEVSVLDFDWSGRRLRVGFTRGMYRHEGGIAGRTSVAAPLPTPRRCLRVKAEIARVDPRRAFEVVIRPDLAKYRIGAIRGEPLDGPLKGFVAEPLRVGAGAEAATILKRAGLA